MKCILSVWVLWFLFSFMAYNVEIIFHEHNFNTNKYDSESDVVTKYTFLWFRSNS